MTPRSSTTSRSGRRARSTAPSWGRIPSSEKLTAVVASEIGRYREAVEKGLADGDKRASLLHTLVEPFPAFIIEVKKADSPDADLKQLAREAREQIDGRQYDATFRAEGIAEIEKIGLAYCKGKVEICR